MVKTYYDMITKKVTSEVVPEVVNLFDYTLTDEEYQGLVNTAQKLLDKESEV